MTSEYLHNCHSRPKVKQSAEYKLKDFDEWPHVQNISRAGKASGKYESSYNVRDLGDDTLHILDWNTIDKWKLIANVEEVFLSAEESIDSDLLQAKLYKVSTLLQSTLYFSSLG